MLDFQVMIVPSLRLMRKGRNFTNDWVFIDDIIIDILNDVKYKYAHMAIRNFEKRSPAWWRDGRLLSALRKKIKSIEKEGKTFVFDSHFLGLYIFPHHRLHVVWFPFDLIEDFFAESFLVGGDPISHRKEVNDYLHLWKEISSTVIPEVCLGVEKSNHQVLNFKDF